MSVHAGIGVVACTDAHEGPVYAPDERAVYFTSVGGEAIKRLDVGDSETSQVWAIGEDGRRLFAEIARGYPDGLETDAAGRVYTTSADGIEIFDPDGAHVGAIRVPGAVNFAFGPDELFITSDT